MRLHNMTLNISPATLSGDCTYHYNKIDVLEVDDVTVLHILPRRDLHSGKQFVELSADRSLKRPLINLVEYFFREACADKAHNDASDL